MSDLDNQVDQGRGPDPEDHHSERWPIDGRSPLDKQDGEAGPLSRQDPGVELPQPERRFFPGESCARCTTVTGLYSFCQACWADTPPPIQRCFVDCLDLPWPWPHAVIFAITYGVRRIDPNDFASTFRPHSSGAFVLSRRPKGKVVSKVSDSDIQGVLAKLGLAKEIISPGSN